MNTYNGWSNYATWKINLELIDGYETDTTDAYALVDELQELAGFYFDDYPDGLVKDCANAFISDVNWYEIAEHLIEESN
jgi:hypothetical protein